MMMTKALIAGAALAASALLWAPSTAGAQPTQGRIAIDRDDIAGVVTGAKGAEAGVWVIAETTDLPTKFARIVVTDDQGRYLLPDLPKATPDALKGGDPAMNAAIARKVLGGERGPARDVVLFNSGAMLLVADRVRDLRDGIAHAASLIDSGKAAATLERLAAESQA